MTILGKNKLVDALDWRYQAFRKKLVDLLEGANGSKDADQVARLWKELRGQIGRIEEHMGSGNQTIEDDAGNVLPRPKVGETVKVWRYDYDGAIVTGTIIKDDGNLITVEVPEEIIPPRPQQVIPAFTVTAVWEWEYRQWVDWSVNEEAE